jgi:hypothetical protein
MADSDELQDLADVDGPGPDPDPAAGFTRDFVGTVDDVDAQRKWVVSRINTDALDSFQTVILPGGMDKRAFDKNPVVLWHHGKDPSRGLVPMGRSAWVKGRPDRGDVIAKTVFAEDDFGRGMFELYRDGVVKGWSVNGTPGPGCGPPTAEEVRRRPELQRCKMVYRSWTLKEYSGTPFPGNPDTITEAVSRGLWLPDVLRSMAEGSGAGGGYLTDGGKAVERTIVHQGGRWFVKLESTGKLVPDAGYPSEAEAKAYLANLEAHKEQERAAEPPGLPPLPSDPVLPPLVGREMADVEAAVFRRLEAELPGRIARAYDQAEAYARGRV